MSNAPPPTGLGRGREEKKLTPALDRAIYAFGIAQQEVGRAYQAGEPDEANTELREWQRYASTQRDDALAELQSVIQSHIAGRVAVGGADGEWLRAEIDRLGTAERDWLDNQGDASATAYAEECQRLRSRYARILAALGVPVGEAV